MFSDTSYQPSTAVIIVNYNSGPLLAESVGAVLGSTAPAQVIVSDNGSADDSLHTLRAGHGSSGRLTIVENGENLGFAKANNRALTLTKADYLLFLNPDCIVEPDTIERMTALLASSEKAGMAGCLILNSDGTPQPACRRKTPTPWRSLMRLTRLERLFPNNPRFAGFELSSVPLPTKPTAVDAISGASMLVKKEALAKVGPMDEGYFLHCEDLDWCERFRQNGYDVLFAPQITVVHHKGACSAGEPVRVLWNKSAGMARFYRKFFSDNYSLPLTWLVIAAIWIRFAVLAIIEIGKRTLMAKKSL